MWVLMDGNLMPKDVAVQAGTTSMSVSRFLNAGLAAGLIEYHKGDPPKRALDYVPPAWIEGIELDVKEETNNSKNASQQKLV